jgi:hypothetical protein
MHIKECIFLWCCEWRWCLYLGDELIMVSQMSSAMDTRIESMTIGQISLERLDHGAVGCERFTRRRVPHLSHRRQCWKNTRIHIYKPPLHTLVIIIKEFERTSLVISPVKKPIFSYWFVCFKDKRANKKHHHHSHHRLGT